MRSAGRQIRGEVTGNRMHACPVEGVSPPIHLETPMRPTRPLAIAEAVAAGGRASDAPGAPDVDPLRPHFPLGALAGDDEGRLCSG
jgi:hypothetical protein